jgi:probable rRNA maturation factor
MVASGTRGEVVVDVVDRQRFVAVGAAWLERVVRRALDREGIARAVVSILLVGDRKMARLHEEWLGIPGPTDVISFDLAGAGPAAGRLEGDVVVSTETARRVARELRWQPRHEVAYCAIHGLLHLAGYDDLAPASRRAMRARERVWLRAAGLPPPPRARARPSRRAP